MLQMSADEQEQKSSNVDMSWPLEGYVVMVLKLTSSIGLTRLEIRLDSMT
jgi:hypothetical protein